MIFTLIALLIATKTDATVGYAAMNLDTGKVIRQRGDVSFPMASVFKLPIALTLLQRVDKGEVFLTKEVTITPDQFSFGHSPLRDSANGKPVTVTIGRLLELMLGDSDNTAGDYLLGVAGGPAAVTKRMRELGAGGIRVDRPERETIADLRKPGGAARYAKDVRDTSTPNAMLTLLAKLQRAQVGLSAESREIALRIMTETESGPNRIRAGIPKDAMLAHKTGTMDGTLNDVGIIDGRIAIAIFTKGAVKSSTADREKLVAEIAGKLLKELK
ncbi:MAG TPA: class A beta-lactamase [Thermoanaerobaculia bacterium]|nr:class A beta-lactamase [Thermoanaerobaculia bacterium]